MTKYAIEVDGVEKHFKLYHEKFTSLKERVIKFGKIPYEEFWALKGIDLRIEEGETYGLIGHNGSGKSTLLKIIAGILQPTSGEVRTRGRLAALLELGAGFHPDLTGRENVYMNAALLGLKEKEIDKKFDEIVAFAELEKFIDNQVKFYSSGMYVRLGFAVAVNMDPDVLLVDEVLAVGDEAFQRKCIDRVKKFQKEGRTIVLVSHGLDQVRQVCTRAAVLDHGTMVAEGDTGLAIRTFREYLLSKGVEPEEQITLSHGEEQSSKANKTVQITGVQVQHRGDGSKPYMLPGEGLDVTISYETQGRVDDIVFGMGVHDLEGRDVFGWNTKLLETPVAPIEGTGSVTFSFDSIPLLDGDYKVSVAAHNEDEGTVYDWHDQLYSFEVMYPGKAAGLVWAPASVTVRKDAATV